MFHLNVCRDERDVTRAGGLQVATASTRRLAQRFAAFARDDNNIVLMRRYIISLELQPRLEKFEPSGCHQSHVDFREEEKKFENQIVRQKNKIERVSLRFRSP